MVKRRKAVTVAAVLLLMTGCGGTGSDSEVTAAADSASCIDCHREAVSPVTGNSIVSEWRQSIHSSGRGAGCRDCHEPLPSHPSSCGVCHGGTPAGSDHDVARYPDTGGKCLKCHGPATTASFRGYSGTGYSTAAIFHAHFSNLTTGRFPASYLPVTAGGKCRNCHAPHNPTGHRPKNTEWAGSAHADVSGVAWTANDFRTRGTAGASPAVSTAEDCVRCHTESGYVTYVTSGFTAIPPVAPRNSSKLRGKQVLGCRTCHDDGGGNSYSFKRRTVAPATVYYNYSSTATGRILGSVAMPDLRTSNLCVPCHSGRTRGEIITRADEAGTGFTKLSFINPHYRAGAGILLRTAGYHYSGRSYDDPLNFEHSRIGIGNFRGTGTDGPCVACHMKPARHTYTPLTHTAKGEVAQVVSTMCDRCHERLGAASLEKSRLDFLAALDALKYFLGTQGFNHTASYPYYYTQPYVPGYRETGSCDTNIAVTNWQTGGAWNYVFDSTRKACNATSLQNAGVAGTGPNNLGAAFNYNLLLREPAAYVHNTTYARRLIYDAIDWLDDNTLNYSTGNSLSAVSNTFRDGALRYLIPTDPAGNPVGLTGTGNPAQRP